MFVDSVVGLFGRVGLVTSVGGQIETASITNNLLTAGLVENNKLFIQTINLTTTQITSHRLVRAVDQFNDWVIATSESSFAIWAANHSTGNLVLELGCDSVSLDCFDVEPRIEVGGVDQFVLIDSVLVFVDSGAKLRTINLQTKAQTSPLINHRIVSLSKVTHKLSKNYAVANTDNGQSVLIKLDRDRAELVAIHQTNVSPTESTSRAGLGWLTETD